MVAGVTPFNFRLFIGHLGTEGNLEGSDKSETQTDDIKARGDCRLCHMMPLPCEKKNKTQTNDIMARGN